MTPRRTDLISKLIWPLLIMAVAVLWILLTLGILPPTFMELVQRGWPALLVALGLMLLFGRRARLGNVIAVGMTIIFTGGVVVASFNRESGKVREDYKAPFAFTVPAEVTSIRADITALLTTVEIQPAPAGERAIRGEFVGSLESLVTSDFQVASGVGTFVLREAQRNAVPSLLQIGRGRLTLFLPAGINFEQLTITGRDGDLTLDLSSVPVKALAVTLEGGNIDAKFADTSGLIGDLKTRRGDVTVTIPPTRTAEIALLGPGADAPQFNENAYTLRIDKVLVPNRRDTSTEIQLRLEGTGKLTVR